MKYYDKFVNKLDEVLKDEDYKVILLKNYLDKKEYIMLKLKDVLKGETKEFIQDVTLNKEEYIQEVCCYWEKLFNPLSEEQKLIVIANSYNLYTLDPITNSREYEDPKNVLKIIDEGRVDEYKVSAVGTISDYMRDLTGVSSSDVIFWLHNEWYNLSGDWFDKLKNRDYISRGTNRFTSRNYQAFNEIIKKCIGRELKCIDKYRNKTIIDEFKEALGE